MQIGLISDYNVINDNKKLDISIVKSFMSVDLILHAGEITQRKVLTLLDEIAPVKAVATNGKCYKLLPLNDYEIIEAENKRIILTHGDNFATLNELYEFSKSLNGDIVVSGFGDEFLEKINDMILINPGRSLKILEIVNDNVLIKKVLK